MKLVAGILVLSSLGLAQQSSTTSGPCSPIAPNNRGSITIDCPGLSEAQGDALLRIVNKILENQIDPATVLAKLEEMHRDIRQVRDNQGWPELTNEELATITKRCQPFAGQKSEIAVLASGRDTSRLGEQLSEALQAAGWHAPAPKTAMAIGEHPRGIQLRTNASEPDAPLRALALVFSEVFGRSSVHLVRNRKLPDGFIKIEVFFKAQ